MVDKKEKMNVYDSNSHTIKNGNKLGNIAFKNKSKDDCTDKILDLENATKQIPKTIIKIVKK